MLIRGKMLKRLVRPSLAVPMVIGILLAAPAISAAQNGARNRDANDGGGNAGQAVPRASAPAPAPSPAPAPAPAPAPPPSAPEAAPARTRGAITSDSSTDSPNQGARPRQGRATVGTAVPRGSVPAPPRPNPPIIVPPYYDSYWPWGFGGLGFGFGSYYGGYYNSLYDPWYGYGYGGGYPPSSYTVGLEGSLRLKIKPRDAQVFVDGYYVGVVDSFDGTFQRLHVDAGPHRIEVRAPGFESLIFDVRVQFDETTKLEGEMRRLP